MGLQCRAKNYRHSTGELIICWLPGGRGWVLAFPPPFQLLKWILYVSVASRLIACPQKLPFEGMRLFTHLSQHCSPRECPLFLCMKASTVGRLSFLKGNTKPPTTEERMHFRVGRLLRIDSGMLDSAEEASESCSESIGEIKVQESRGLCCMVAGLHHQL